MGMSGRVLGIEANSFIQIVQGQRVLASEAVGIAAVGVDDSRFGPVIDRFGVVGSSLFVLTLCIECVAAQVVRPAIVRIEPNCLRRIFLSLAVFSFGLVGVATTLVSRREFRIEFYRLRE